MAEKLEIVIAAKDQASAVLKGVASNLKGEIKAIEGAHASLATSATGMATQTQGAFKSMTGYVQAHEAQLRTAGAAMVGFGATITAVAAKSIALYGESEVAGAKLTAAIKGTRQSIDQSRLEKLAKDLQKTTTFEDDATIAMMAMLTTFDLTQDQIEQLSPRILNIAAIMGTDLQSAAIAVGKAISTNSYGALQRFGIIIDEDTKKSGNFVDILKAIDRNTGPAAEELAKTATGALMQFKNAMGDAGESVGKALVPALRAMVTVLKPTADLLNKVADTPFGTVFITAGAALGVLMVPLGGVLMALPSLVKGWTILTGAQARNTTILAAHTVALGADTVAAEANAAANAVSAVAMASQGGGAGIGVAKGVGIGMAEGIGGAAEVARRGLLGRGITGGGRVIGGAARLLGPAARVAGPVAMVATGAAIAYHYGRENILQGGKAAEQLGERYGQRAAIESWAAQPTSPAVTAARRRANIAAAAETAIARRQAVSSGWRSATEQSYAAQGWTQDQSGAWSAPEGARVGSTRRPAKVTASSPNIDISQQGNETIVRISQDPDPGALDDATTAYLDDIMYAGDDL